ncbi:MAG: hypothetical protein U9P90_04150 [Patescibacteria group bacterium]|nr:hypothetical protein [Patescibacteria group bacterium]
MELETIEKEAIEKVEQEELQKLSFQEITTEELIKVLSLTIKEDNANKLSVFLTLLSAYSGENQMNIIFSAPSASGKSFVALETADLFPTENIIDLAYASPSAFFHRGIYDKETGKHIIDLREKILIFLDMPNAQLLQNLRPLFSHDKKEIKLEITDRSKKKQELRTKKIVIQGWPAVIFCSANNQLNEQEITRFLLLSPETSQSKIKQAIIEKLKKESDSDRYITEKNANPERQNLKQRIKAIRAQKIKKIILSKELEQKVLDFFLSKNKHLKPKHNRDIAHLLSMTKIFCLLNLWSREVDEQGRLLANQTDFENALMIWNEISEAQERSVSPYLLALYKEVVVACWKDEAELDPQNGMILKEGLTRSEIAKKHLEVYGTAITDLKLRREVIPMLEAGGLISLIENPDDKRKFLIKPNEL